MLKRLVLAQTKCDLNKALSMMACVVKTTTEVNKNSIFTF